MAFQCQRCREIIGDDLYRKRSKPNLCLDCYYATTQAPPGERRPIVPLDETLPQAQMPDDQAPDKSCSICGSKLNLDNCHLRTRNGRQYWGDRCRPCDAARKRKSYEASHASRHRSDPPEGRM